MKNLLSKAKPSYREIRPMRGRLMRGPPVLYFRGGAKNYQCRGTDGLVSLAPLSILIIVMLIQVVMDIPVTVLYMLKYSISSIVSYFSTKMKFDFLFSFTLHELVFKS